MFIYIVHSSSKANWKEEIGYHFSWVLKLHCAHTFQLNRANNNKDKKIKRSMQGSQTNEFEVNKGTYQHSSDTKKINILYEHFYLYFIALHILSFSSIVCSNIYLSLYHFNISSVSVYMHNYHDQQIVHMEL